MAFFSPPPPTDGPRPAGGCGAPTLRQGQSPLPAPPPSRPTHFQGPPRERPQGASWNLRPLPKFLPPLKERVHRLQTKRNHANDQPRVAWAGLGRQGLPGLKILRVRFCFVKG
ncbi:metacaspase-1B-like [Sarcophilus harrisii]|uniref:metacaspase-1B-like n=1 Tax=Sarcophilus harrisii TaxID=9305 RepID=UPI001301DE30|nr:metacaspase-1B-like [Sarcophilus harrisii]